MKSKSAVKFHVNYSHYGGQRCSECGYVGFSEEAYKKHSKNNCKKRCQLAKEAASNIEEADEWQPIDDDLSDIVSRVNSINGKREL